LEGEKIKLNKALLSIFISFIVFVFSASYVLAANLFLAPSAGTYSVGNTFSAVVKVNTEGVAINAIEGTLVFNPNELAVISLSKAGSIFDLWVQEPEFSNTLGTINFGGIIFNPGFTGSSGTIITVNFRAKAVSNTKVAFSSGAVLANDGLGTNVLSTMGGGVYTLKSTAAVPVPKETPQVPSVPSTGKPSAPNITSPTHPDQGDWYSNNNPVFKWEVPEDVTEVKLILSEKAGTAPVVSYIPPISSKKIENLDDGIYYLNARFKNSFGYGPIASYKVKIDTTAPNDFEIERVNKDDPTNPRPKLLFATEDNLSGIDRYEMKIGDGDWFEIPVELAGKPYKLLLQMPGKHPVIVRAYDKADNFSEASLNVEVKSIPVPVIEKVYQKAPGEKTIIIKGKGIPNEKVLLFILREGKFQSSILSNDKVVKVLEIETFNGLFEVEVELPPGDYSVHAYSKDSRGAISDVSNMVHTELRYSFFDKIFDMVMRGFDSLIKFIINGWLLIIFIFFFSAFIYLLIKEIIPWTRKELREVGFIYKEYRLSKRLIKKNRKMRFEMRELYNDFKKELNLLKTIERHRPLHSDEKYLKQKIEKYMKLLKSFLNYK